MKLVLTDCATVTNGDLDLHVLDRFGEVMYYPLTAPEELVERLSGADAMICNKTVVSAEIMEKCPFDVVHELQYEKVAKKGRPSIIGITFSKVAKPSVIKDPTAVLAQKELILLTNLGFNERGIRSNLSLFRNAKNAGVNLEEFLIRIDSKARQANSPQGYIIRSLQNIIAGQKPFTGNPVNVNPVDVPPITPAITKTLHKSAGKNKERLEVKSAEAFSESGIEEI